MAVKSLKGLAPLEYHGLLNHLDFFQQLVHAGVPLFQVDSLDGTFFIAWPAICRMHDCRCTHADHLFHFVVGSRVRPRWPRRFAAVHR
jgi:hypothetical protein